jgi:formate hydrogenlyase subunit 3/multisubunit Na+/H+ antiporter MnhD subunit
VLDDGLQILIFFHQLFVLCATNHIPSLLQLLECDERIGLAIQVDKFEMMIVLTVGAATMIAQIACRGRFLILLGRRGLLQYGRILLGPK